MIASCKNGDGLKVYLQGEIDHAATEELRESIEKLLADEDVRHLILDFSRVTFMDSSGIGMIIGRYKTMMRKHGRISACAMTPGIERLFRMAGLHRIIDIEQEDNEQEGK